MTRLISEPGSDGVVRWAGCSLNTRKIVIDLTRDPARPASEDRTSIAPWSNADVPMIPLAGLNHGSILSAPTQQAVDLVLAALEVSSAAEFDAWQKRAMRETKATRDGMGEWQQFVVRCVADPSLRCFHVNLAKLDDVRRRTLQVRLIASSGSGMVGHHGVGSEKLPLGAAVPDADGKWDACLDIASVIGDEGVKFFYPFTTTLIELRLNREPLPLSGVNLITRFLAEEA